MAISPDVVRRLTVVATERGLTSLKQNLRETDRAFDQVAASSTRAATATEAADRRMMALLRQRDRLATAMNAGGLGGVGRTAANDLGDAAAFATSRIVPLVAAAGTAVVAYKALNAVWERGAELLDEYGNAQRKLVDGVDEALKKLTRFQDAGLSAEQVQRATELGARLIEAKRTIDEFFQVHLNLTNAALRLQSVWVGIVEAIAKAVEWANRLPPAASTAAGVIGRAAIGAMPGGGAVNAFFNLTSEKSAPAISQADALAAAYERLRGAMGSESNFAVRFSAIKDIPKDAEKATKAIEETTMAFDQYDNALQRLRDQNEVLEEQIKWLGKTTEEVDRLRAARELERAAAKAGRDITPEMRVEIDAEAAAYARLREELRNVNEQRRMVESLGSAIVGAFTGGGDAVQRLTSSLASLGTQLASRNLSNFLNGGSLFGNQRLMSAGGAAGMLGAGAMGYQSGSPLMGALGGAMAGASFGPLGMLAGGAIGGIAGLFGGRSQRRQQQAQERAEREALIQQANMQAQLAGIDTSTRSGSIAAMEIQNQAELAEAAKKGWEVRIAVENKQRAEMAALNQDWDKREAEIEKQKREEELRLAEELAQAIKARKQSFSDMAFDALNDTSTIDGQLRALAREEQRAIEQEIEAGGQAMVELAEAFEARRYRLHKDANDQIIAETKRAEEERAASLKQAARGIVDYLLGLQTGADSPLSPSQRLSAAQQGYNATLGLAQGGNIDALNRITRDAEVLRTAAQSFFGSGSGYQSIFNQIQQQLAGLPSVQASTDPIVAALLQVVTAVQGTTGAVQGTTGAVNTTGASNDNLMNTQIAVDNVQASHLATSVSILTEIRTLNSTSASLLSLMTAQLTQRSVLSVNLGAGGTHNVQNNMLDALNKIVANTYATSFNIRSLQGISGQILRNMVTGGGVGMSWTEYGATLASGGRVSGPGTPTSDSIPAWLSTGEGVINAAAMRSFDAIHPRLFDDFLNRGRLPATAGATNDNSSAEVRALRRDMAMMLTQLTKVAAQIPVAVHEGFREQNRVIKSEERTQSDDKKARRRGRAA